MPAIQYEYDEHDIADPERAATARRQKAEQLADKLMEDGAELWVEWLDGRLDRNEIAQLVAETFPKFRRVELRDEFVDFVLKGRFK